MLNKIKLLLVEIFRSNRFLLNFSLRVASGSTINKHSALKSKADEALLNKSKLDKLLYRTVLHCLSSSNDPVSSLNYFSEVLKFNNKVLWQALSELLTSGSKNFDRIIEDAGEVSSVEIRIQLLIKRGLLDYSNKEVILYDLYEDYCNNKGILIKSKSIRYALMGLILEKSSVQMVEDWFGKFGFSIDSISESQRLKFLSRLARLRNKEQFKYWDDLISHSVSATNKLKYQLIKFWAQEDTEGFLKLEKSFFENQTWLSSQCQMYTAYYLYHPGSGNNFLDARFNFDRVCELRKLILDKITNKNSFSYIRLGDGECYGFGENEYIDYQGILRQEQHWWGTELDKDLRKELQSGFLSALPHADIIGVPSILRIIKDYNPLISEEYPKNSLVSRLLSVMKESSLFFNKGVIVEDQSNLYLFDEDFVGSIIKNASKVYLVSGVSSHLVDAWNPDKYKLEYIEIPTHRLLKIGNVGGQVENIFPLVYKEYLDKVSNLSAPGVVFLFSAGFIGKILIAEVSKRGAVGLDFGQYILTATTE